MSQTETLQDIYSQIADIYDKLCDLSPDPETAISEDLTLDKYTSTGIKLDNPDDKIEITNAETQINNLITLALTTAKDNRLSTDAQSQGGDGGLVPVPDGSPIALLPKLINVLVNFKAPLKVILQILSDYIGSILLEQIKRKLNQKSPKLFGTTGNNKSFIIQVPLDAEQIS